MLCVICVSRNRGESGKKREYMTHLKCKKPCKSIIYKVSTCPGLDSNQHTLRRCYLKAVRLPISPPGQVLFGGANIAKDQPGPKKVPTSSGRRRSRLLHFRRLPYWLRRLPADKEHANDHQHRPDQLFKKD